ncbi:Uncharacterised protein [Mycobacteroides abscessus subsp. massiliense]|nr:Uncharacterised protein [Mycobacteroides abscessus subsp. massiliense]
MPCLLTDFGEDISAPAARHGADHQIVIEKNGQRGLKPDAEDQNRAQLLPPELEPLLPSETLPELGALQSHSMWAQPRPGGINRGFPVDVDLRVVVLLGRGLEPSLQRALRIGIRTCADLASLAPDFNTHYPLPSRGEHAVAICRYYKYRVYTVRYSGTLLLPAQEARPVTQRV